MFPQFFDAVFGIQMIKYLTKMKFSAFFPLACGAVVKNCEALAGLQSTVQRYHLFHLFFCF